MFELRKSFFRKFEKFLGQSLREKCPYFEFFWSLFPRIRTDYAEILSIFPYSIEMLENTYQKNSKYGYF